MNTFDTIFYCEYIFFFCNLFNYKRGSFVDNGVKMIENEN